MVANYQVAPWCSGYRYCTTSFNKAWTQVLRRFKSCSRRVGDSRWWGSLTVVPAGNKATPFVGQPYHKNNSSSSSSSGFCKINITFYVLKSFLFEGKTWWKLQQKLDLYTYSNEWHLLTDTFNIIFFFCNY